MVPDDVPLVADPADGLERSPDGSAPDEQTAQLVESALAGDREAFGVLHELYGRRIHAILLRFVAHQEADDLVQDVFLIALRRLSTLQNASAFGEWISQIARNRARDTLRRLRPMAELVDAETSGQDDTLEAEEILETIRSLPEAYQETLIMRLVEGMTGPEIAARAGLTPGSVRVNLHRGFQLLRSRLDGAT